MKEVAKLQIKDRTELFQATAISMGMQPNVIEKDFWVCFMLDHLFHDCRYKNAFVFKGGTSLSKSYHVIERFSEDIDLILDWRKIINDEVNPWEERSKTKQDLFNKQINSEAAKFYKEELIPQLNIEMKEKLGDGEWISVDTEDEMVVNFYYPQIFEAEYLRSCVRLEIGPLAEWLPSHETSPSPNEEIIPDTIRALEKRIGKQHLRIKEYTLEQLRDAIKNGDVDVFLASSGFYRRMVQYGASSLATVASKNYPDPNHSDGAALIVRNDSGIRTLYDAKGSVLGASSPTAFTEIGRASCRERV